MAAGSSALAPSPYTVSVGNATSSPARIKAAARAISSLFRQILFSVARDFAGVFIDQERVHHPIQVTVQYTVHVADGKLGAMILHHSIRREHVAADLAAEIDLELGILHLLVRRLLLLQFVFVQARAHLLHRAGPVLVLRPFVLALHYNPGRDVRHTHG